MNVGDRLTLLVDEHDFIVRSRSPYTLSTALQHLDGLEPVIAERLRVVVVEVIGAAEAIDRAERDTLPAPAVGRPEMPTLPEISR
jgi:hypothetical protein